jgi:hypothetical protein
MLSAIKNTFRVPILNIGRLIYTTSPRTTEKFDHKRIPTEDEGVQGEKLIDLDAVLKS